MRGQSYFSVAMFILRLFHDSPLPSLSRLAAVHVLLPFLTPLLLYLFTMLCSLKPNFSSTASIMVAFYTMRKMQLACKSMLLLCFPDMRSSSSAAERPVSLLILKYHFLFFFIFVMLLLLLLLLLLFSRWSGIFRSLIF